MNNNNNLSALFSNATSFSNAQVPLSTFHLYGNPVAKTNTPVPKPQHVKDLGDIIFGMPISGTEQLKRTLEDNGLGNLKYVPLLNRIAGAGLLFKERAIEPIVKKEPATLFINTLETLGGTADTLSNIVKSLLPVAGGGSYEDFLDSLGWRVGVDRKQYQFDTGNIITDVLGEMLADPTTWMDIIGKALVDGSAEALTKQTRDAMSDVLYKRYAKQAGDVVAREAVKNQMKLIPDEFINNIITSIADDLGSENPRVLTNLMDALYANNKYLDTELLKASGIKEKQIKALVNTNKELLYAIGDGDLQKSIMKIRYTDGYKSFDKGKKLLGVADDIDRTLLLAGLQLSTSGPLLFKINKELGVTDTLANLWNHKVMKLSKIDPKDVLKDKTGSIKRIRKYISDLYDLRFGEIYRNDVLYGDYKKQLFEYATKVYETLLKNTSYTKFDNVTIDNKFYNLVTKRFRMLSNLTKTELMEVLQPARAKAIDLFHSTEYVNAMYRVQRGLKQDKVKNNKWMRDKIETLFEAWRPGDGTDLEFALRNFTRLTNKQYTDLTTAINLLGLDLIDRNELADIVRAYKKGDDIKVTDKLIKAVYNSKYGALNAALYFNTPAFTTVTKNYEQHLGKLNILYKQGASNLNNIISDTNNPLHQLFKISEDRINSFIDDMKASVPTIESARKEVTKIRDYLFDELEADIDDYRDVVKIFGNDLDINIDPLIDYDISTGDLFTSVIFDIFEKEDIDADDLKLFYDNLSELRFRVHHYYKELETSYALRVDLDNVEHDLRILKDLDNLLKQNHVNKLLGDIKDLLNTHDETYGLIISASGRRTITNRAVLDHPVYKMLTDVNGANKEDVYELRTLLIKAIRKLRSMGTDTAVSGADNLAYILATIDNTANINELLNTDIEFIKLPNSIKEFILGEIDNAISKPKYNYIAIENMYSNIKEMVDDIMRNIDINILRPSSNTYKTLEDWFVSGLFKDNMNAINHYEDLIKKITDEADEVMAQLHFATNPKDIEKYNKKLKKLAEQRDGYLDVIKRHKAFPDYYGDTTESRMHAWRGDMRTTLRNALYSYIDKVDSINTYYGVSLKLNSVIDKSFVTRLNMLGVDAATLDVILKQKGLDTEHAISNLAHQLSYKTADAVIMDSKERYKMLRENNVGNELGFDIHEFGVELMDAPLAKVITESFKQIDLLNTQLASMLENATSNKLGKYYSYMAGQTRQAKYFLAYATGKEFNDYIKSETIWDNIYAWSTANRMLGAKKIHPYAFNAAHKLDISLFNFDPELRSISDNAEYLTFLEVFRDANDYTKTLTAVKPKVIKKYKQALIELYSDSTLTFSPKDATLYFNNIDADDIITWYYVSMNSKFNSTNAKKFKDILKRLHFTDEELDAAKTYTNTVNVLSEPGFVSERSLDDIIAEAPSNTGAWISSAIERKLKEYIKDPSTLGSHQAELAGYIQNNVAQNQRILELNDWLGKPTTLGEFLGIKEGDVIPANLTRTLKRNNLSLDLDISSTTLQRFLKRERTEAFAYNLRRMTAKQLRSYIDYNTQGFMVYVSSNTNDVWKYTSKELKEAGLIITGVKDIPGCWVVRRTDNKITNEIYEWIVPKWEIPELQDKFTKFFKDMSPSFYWDEMYIPDELFTGDMVDLPIYNALMNSAEFSKVLGSTEIRKTYLKLDENGINNFFTKDVSRPNGVIVGDLWGQNKLIDYLNNTEKTKYIPKTTLLSKSAIMGSTQAVLRMDTEQKYLQLFFNEDFSVDGKFWKRALDEATDDDIKAMFARRKNVAVILRQNRRGLPQIYKLNIYEASQVDLLRKANAIIVPYEVYRNMVLTINKHKIDSKVLKIYREFIVMTFKTIYLTSPGFLVRNAADSLIYKNLASTGGVLSLADTFKYEHQAAQLLELYDKITNEALAISGSRTLNKRTINAALAKHTAQECAQYRLVDLFLNSYASGGYTKAMQDYLLNFNMKDMVFDGSKFEEFWVKHIVNNPISNYIMDINSQIEQTARLGLFLNLVENSGDVSKAIADVANTHFDYDLFGNQFRLLEEIFWFSTFPLNNIAYYINTGLLKNPELFKLQLDLAEQSWNSGEYSWDMIRESDEKYGLKYHASAGNIRLYFMGNDKDDPTSHIVLKLGSSAFDFFNDLITPTEEMKSHLNPLLSVLLGLEDYTELDPTYATRKRISKVLRGENFLPSIISKSYPQYSKKKYKTGWNANTTKAYRRKTYYKKPNTRARNNYRYITNRYYFGKAPAKHYKVTSIEPYWYKGRSSQARRMMYRVRHKKSELYR